MNHIELKPYGECKYLVCHPHCFDWYDEFHVIECEVGTEDHVYAECWSAKVYWRDRDHYPDNLPSQAVPLPLNYMLVVS